MITPDALLAGPRGRRMLLEYALASEGEVMMDDLEASLRRAVSDASRALDPNPGTMLVARRWWWQRRRARRTPCTPALSPEDVVLRLRRLPLAEPSPERVRAALMQAVDMARYWQEPDGDDALAALLPVQRELRRVAEHLSPHAQWWSTGIDRDAQRLVRWDDDRRATPTSAVAERLRAWREDITAAEIRADVNHQLDPGVNRSGEWWSMPRADLLSTTRALTDESPAGLWFVEDSFYGERATVHHARVPADLVVYEIDGPAAWAALCQRFPLPVTAQKRGDWYRTTGRVGRWVMPDWARVAEHYDGVHLTVAAYVEAAGTAIAVDDETASVIAGWNADETYWFTDDLAIDTDSETWTLDVSDPVPSWRRTSGPTTGGAHRPSP